MTKVIDFPPLKQINDLFAEVLERYNSNTPASVFRHTWNDELFGENCVEFFEDGDVEIFDGTSWVTVSLEEVMKAISHYVKNR